MTNTTVNKTEKRGRPEKLQFDEFFEDAYESLTNEEIAELYNVTIRTVQNMARKNGMRKSKTGRPISMPDASELEEKCKNHTDKEVASVYNVCPGTVAYWRKKLGISKYNKAV